MTATRILLVRLLASLLCTQQCHSLASPNAASPSRTNVPPTGPDLDDAFDGFCSFLERQQSQIIQDIEGLETATFGCDCWGKYSDNETNTKSGGKTRVLQQGSIIDKGACSLTVLKHGTLSAERATTLSARNDSIDIQAGSTYSAAALSMVLHTKNPHVPTFRSDVRLFVVGDYAFLGGGADLTPYYLVKDDIQSFHRQYQQLCKKHGMDYRAFKQNCDNYFYLVARAEHRGVGGIFFDDVPLTKQSLDFTKALTQTWMPSWFPMVQCHKDDPYTRQQESWRNIRRGRYLEFNLLYDRGVKFGLMNENPRVEGVMVSAPPHIEYVYQYDIPPDSAEARLVEVLKHPRDWV